MLHSEWWSLTSATFQQLAINCDKVMKSSLMSLVRDLLQSCQLEQFSPQFFADCNSFTTHADYVDIRKVVKHDESPLSPAYIKSITDPKLFNAIQCNRYAV